MQYVQETFENCSVELDGNSYRECTFRNTVCFYAGGKLDLIDNRFIDVTWQFSGDLGRGLDTIRQLAHSAGPKHVKHFADFLANFIRRPNAKLTVEII